jgi:hypothetical protein
VIAGPAELPASVTPRGSVVVHRATRCDANALQDGDIPAVVLADIAERGRLQRLELLVVGELRGRTLFVLVFVELAVRVERALGNAEQEVTLLTAVQRRDVVLALDQRGRW